MRPRDRPRVPDAISIVWTRVEGVPARALVTPKTRARRFAASSALSARLEPSPRSFGHDIHLFSLAR